MPAAAALLVALLGRPGEAQQRVPSTNGAGFDTHLFRPAVDSKGFFSVNGVNTLGSGSISFGLVTDYGRNLLRLEDGHGDKAIIAHSFQGTFGFNVGLFNRMVLGLQMPVNLMAGEGVTGIGPASATYDSQRLDSQKIGFIALHGKVRLLKNDDAIGVALLLQGGIPVSDAARDLGGEPKAWFWPQILLEKSLIDRTIRVGFNAGYRGGAGGAVTRFDQLDGGKFESSSGLLTGGAAVALRTLDKLEIVAEGYGSQQIGSKSSTALSLSQEVVGGLKIFVERNSFLMLGGGVRLGKGYEAADQRAFLGFVFEPSISDRDNDGIYDDIDECPDEAEDPDNFQDSDGCPDPDNDKDGIPDKRDACPDVKENFNGFQDEDGCPDIDARDRDGDGILDKDDKCPDKPEDPDKFEDEDGCPDPDNDGDGILDVDDRCPLEPEDKDGFQDEDGCPEFDNDNDGIPDSRDACPNEAGPSSEDPKKNGCPVPKGPIVIQDNSILIMEKVQFETGSARIRPVSNGLLDAVARTLKEHPEFELLEVQGHADARGSQAMNLRLTKDRAAAVVKAMVTRGIDAKRLRSMGYGSFCPVDTGASTESLEKNRRVEFKIVVNAGKSTGVELACAEARRNGITSP